MKWKIETSSEWHTPVIILTLKPRSKALLIVSALSWRGGSKRGRRPTNSQGPPGLSLLLERGLLKNRLSQKSTEKNMCMRQLRDLERLITCREIPRERSPRSANLSIIPCTFRSISDLLLARLRIYMAFLQKSSELVEVLFKVKNSMEIFKFYLLRCTFADSLHFISTIKVGKCSPFISWIEW